MPDLPRIPAAGRAAALDALEARAFDLVVVGAGVTGAGVARAAALRGLSVAVLEAADLSSGTSSRSSKLVHGGLRYLAQGEVALVRETALERKHVRALAPHLAEPCWMVVPARSRAGILKFRAGLGTYERLGAVDEADRHRIWDADELARREPALRRDRTPWACAYREYRTDDARLVLANLRAAAGDGAVVASRVPVTGFVREAGRLAGVEARCARSHRTLRVRGRAVVNAAGPWVEEVARLEDEASAPSLHLSKGVHVTLPAERLPVRNLVVVQAADRRSLFVVPRPGSVYVGTTDTSFGRDAQEWPAVTRDDVEYLLAPLARAFDVEPPRPRDCVAAWSGLRPLVQQPGRAPAEISRRDEVAVGPGGLVSVAGGKLTGYRKMAASVLARVAEVLGGLPEAPAEEPPLPGGDFDGDLERLARAVSDETGADDAAAARLVRLYGAEAPAVAAAGPERLVEAAAVVAGEVDWAVTSEAAESAEDVLYRRTRAALDAPAGREALADAIAARMAGLFGWDAERRAAEAAAARERLASDLDFAAAPTAAASEDAG